MRPRKGRGEGKDEREREGWIKNGGRESGEQRKVEGEREEREGRKKGADQGREE